MKFEIYEDELPSLDKWLEEHECGYTKDPFAAGAIGGRLTYQFTPTSLGQITVVRCLCGKEVNITNTDSW